MSCVKLRCYERIAGADGCRFVVGLIGITGLAVASVAGCRGRGAAQEKGPSMPPAIVTLAPATASDVPIYLDEIGKVLAMQIVSVVPQVGGKLIAAHVEDGADVKKGQLLFEIDPRPFEAALASAKATLEQSEAELALAQIELKRTASAIASAAVSELQFDQKKSAVAVAEAHVAAGKAAVQTAELNLEYTKIYSPVTGRAGALLIHPGNVVRENAAALLTIEQLDPIYAEFTVTENDLGVVRSFMKGKGLDIGGEGRRSLKVEVSIPTGTGKALTALGEAAATLSAAPMPTPGSAPTAMPQASRVGDAPREGTLTFLDNEVQEGGRVRLRATLPNTDRRFWPGQFVNVRLVLTTKKDAVLIPAEARQIGQVGPFVYVVGDDRVAQMRPIIPGQLQGNMLVVAKGVQAGEKVIVTGHMLVVPGQPVMVMGDGPPGGGMPGMPGMSGGAGGPAGGPPGATSGATRPAEAMPGGTMPSVNPDEH